MADFTVVTQGSSCKIIIISANDFIKSFKNCIEKVKQIYDDKCN